MAKNIDEARRVYLEQYGSALVTNTYLRVGIVVIAVALVAVIGLSISMFSWAKNQKPMVIRIGELGDAVPVNYSTFNYRPEEREVRYFLAQFVQLHFGRMVSGVEERYGRSLYFLDSKLSQALMEEERKSQSITKFVREGTEEIDITVRNIALEDLRTTPMKGRVDFEKIFYSRADHQELRRERYAGFFEFVVRENVPNIFVLVNPLGLTITYFRTDAYFDKP